MQTTVEEATKGVATVRNLVVEASNKAHGGVGYWPSTKPYAVANARIKLLRDLMNRALSEDAKLLAAFEFCDDPTPDCTLCDGCNQCRYHGTRPCAPVTHRTTGGDA